MKLRIHAVIDYALPQPTDLILHIEAAHLPEQSVLEARLNLSEVEHFARVAAHDCVGERLLIRAQERLTADYTTTVEVHRILAEVDDLEALPPHMLPGETVQYLLDSFYCPGSEFISFVSETFGDTQGGQRIAAIRDYVNRHFRYLPGVSTPQTTALNTFVRRQGVCRDFAHMVISLARASCIPARFASVYASGVTPQDFHAVAEVFLEGSWHLVDATGMATAGEMGKIGIGRDAADVAFLTSFGPVILNSQSVDVQIIND
jgi:transglutaminase-like putative cysteine protease